MVSLACLVVLLTASPIIPAFRAAFVPRWSLVILPAKILCALVLAGLFIADLVLAVVGGATPADLLAVASSLAACLVAAPLHVVSHPRTRHGLGALLLYWLLRAMASLVYMRTLIILGKTDARFVLLCVNIGFMFAVLILECLPKMTPHTQTTASLGSVQYQALPSGDDEQQQQQQQVAEEEEHRQICPEDLANIFSRFSFWWLNALIAMGHKKPLEQDDIFPVPERLEVRNCALNVQGNAEVMAGRGRRFMFRVVWSSLGWTFFYAGVLTFFTNTLSFFQPQFLSAMLTFLEERATAPVERGYLIAIGMFSVALIQSVIGQQSFHVSFGMGVRLRTGLVTAIFDKSLGLSNTVRQRFSTGEAVNLMSIDAQRLMDFTNFAHSLWATPLQVGIAFYFLYEEIGAAVFAGLFVMAVIIPLDTVVSRNIKKVQKSHMTNKDQRMKLLDELVSTIKIVKLYAWEKAYEQRLVNTRSMEMSTLRSIFTRIAAQVVLWSGLPVLVTVSSLGAFVILYDEPLTPVRAFVSLSLFSLLQAPLSSFPTTITSAIDAYVALGRLAVFFASEELQADAIERLPHDPSARDAPAVRAKDAAFAWSADLAPSVFRLRGLTFDSAPGSLTAILGPVGAGKSSLMSSLLGELIRERGVVTMRGRVAYVPQQAWIMNATLQENILFGLPMDQQLYAAVLAASDLQEDLALLPAGDQTEIGEKGINLSGGQKQRVSLSRAAYARADVYLLDDPLSAVDPKVAGHIFQHLIGPEGLLRGATRLLVTHRLENLDQVDQLLLMREGEIVEQGTYADLRAREGGVFSTLMATFGSAVPASGAPSPAPADPEGGEKKKGEKKQEKEGGKKGKKDKGDGKLVQKEYKVTGSVGSGIYKAYAQATGIPRIVLLLVFLLLVQAAQIGSSIWLQEWSTATDGVERVGLYLGVYAALGMAQVLLAGMQAITASIYCGLHASEQIYMRMFLRVVHSPMSFFETTPLGRILNRFSKDVDSVDLNLPRSMSGFLRQLFIVLGIFVAITYSLPPFAPVILPVGIAYFWMQRYFMPTKRDLKRLDSVLRSPTLAHFAETLTGLVTVRAFDQQPRFQEGNRLRVSQQLSAYYYSIVTNRWQGVRLDVLGSLVILTTGLLVVALLGPEDAALGGIAITYALQLTVALNTLVRTSAETETHIVALERMREYDTLPQEAPQVIEGSRPPPTWPSQGVVAFRHYSTRYREGLEPALHDVDFETRPHEKVGVIGRTGAGKSTTLVAIPRLLEPTEGTIEIDGVDITKIGLWDLRTRLAVIPQDPILLTGTLRENLDPFSEHADDALWRALASAQLDSYIRSQPGGLQFSVTNSGGNLSVGQRQLLCLARALLHRAKVLLLDEATAAVDVETDERIQQIIRTEFANSTVFTIAHRLNTVMDSDRILVIGAGKVIDFDTPAALETKGIFQSLS